MPQMKFVDIHTHRPTMLHIEPSGVGIHPWDAGCEVPESFGDRLAEAQLIGEIGLDFACPVPRDRQTEVFRMQLKIAAATGKPVLLHCVRAFEPTMSILAEYALKAVIFHGFIGSEQQAMQAVGRGYCLSFGARCIHSPKTVRALLAVPLTNLFLETDDDRMSIEEMYNFAADVKELSVGELQHAILNNYQRIFNDDEQ